MGQVRTKREQKARTFIDYSDDGEPYLVEIVKDPRTGTVLRKDYKR